MVEMGDGEHDPNVGTGTRHLRGLGVFLFEPFYSIRPPPLAKERT